MKASHYRKVVGSGAVLLAAPALAGAQTAPAGTAIENVAAAHWSIGEATGDGRSNPDRLIVAERLDVALASPAASAGVDAIPVVLTNRGNGQEAFAIAAATAAGRAVALAIDADGDGRYDPARDPPLRDGTTSPLAPGAALRLLALAPDTAVVSARAVTGSGAAGTVFVGAGDGGGDAVVGATGAAARLVLSPDEPDPGARAGSLAKTQAVVAPDGSARPVPGATITYSLVARFTAAAPGAIVEDRVPAGTRYVAGSLRLDGAGLTDAADADAGDLADGVVRVRLGDAAAAETHTVTFAVILP